MISFIVPTVGRFSLLKTLASIETLPGDEVLVVGSVGEMMNLDEITTGRVRFVPCAPGGDWGHSERNFATPLCKGRYIAHIDDDDVYVPGMRALMQDAIMRSLDQPVIFRMRFPNGITLWQNPVIRCGNLGTPCFLIPNQPERLGTWGSFVGGDCAFLEGCKWAPEEFVWRPEVIALLGHNIG